MITALETARRLVLMATLLTLDTILPPSSSDAPRDARRAAPRWAPGTRRASGRCNRRERSGAHGGAHDDGGWPAPTRNPRCEAFQAG
jgi:hypothetical protein